jgi:hypothetical protein
MSGLLERIDGSARGSGKARDAMEHHEAIETMASERYLLDELTPELRDAYEEHLFGCTECADDLRFGAAFIESSKAVLPGMAAAIRVKSAPAHKPEKEKRDWFAWLRPALMVPAFACLLAIVAYQNLVVYPALEASASEPRLLPPATVLAGETRSGLPVVYADLVTGSTLTIPLPQNGGYAAYKFDFYDSKSKLIWTHTQRSAGAADDLATIWLPGRIKQDSYKLSISGVTANGENIPIQQQFFELRIKK